MKGFNDLETLYPALAAEWDPEKNTGLTPDQVTVASHRKVWWQCPNGHVWQAVIQSRTVKRPCGCPVCAGMLSESRRARYKQIMKEAVNPDD